MNNGRMYYPSGYGFDVNDNTQKHWKGGWQYRVGDVVEHREYPGELVGVIVRQKFDHEVDGDMDQLEPWYEIMWVIGNPALDGLNYPHEGQEHEASLNLIKRYNPYR